METILMNLARKHTHKLNFFPKTMYNILLYMDVSSFAYFWKAITLLAYNDLQLLLR